MLVFRYVLGADGGDVCNWVEGWGRTHLPGCICIPTCTTLPELITGISYRAANADEIRAWELTGFTLVGGCLEPCTRFNCS